MQPLEFIKKITDRYLWLNIAAMAAVVGILIVGTSIAMNLYTHHGESIVVPDVRKHSFENTIDMLEDLGFEVVVNDTGYVKSLPPGTILEQMPLPGARVKSGRIIYLTINADDSPTIPLPDIIDNCSLREAQAKLTSMGFKLGETQYVPGEKDWVYGILVNGHNITAGQRVSIESKLIIQVGNGQRDAADSIFMTEKEYDEFEETPAESPSTEEPASTGGGESDEFEVVE